ncbi:Ras GTPase [Orbilia javanica]|uniref:Ras GTPase n=1 Tax=Orbilia javanica TaxID=47235 RepID=A0AAN8MWL4_9PEZI
MSSTGTARFSLREHRISILSSPGSGKYTFILRYMGYRNCWGSIDEFYPKDDIHRRQCLIDDKIALTELYPIRNMSPDHFSMAVEDRQGFLLMYSITSRDSFEAISTFHQQIRQIKGEGPLPIVVVGNKCDMATVREVSIKEGRDLARSLGAGFIETSSRNSINIDESVYELVRRMRNLDELQEPEKENIKPRDEPDPPRTRTPRWHRRRIFSFRAAHAWPSVPGRLVRGAVRRLGRSKLMCF